MSIASRLRRALEARDLPIRAFQREMEALEVDGSSYPAIHRALQGKGTPSIAFLEAAADLLKVRRAWLMAGDGDMELGEALAREEWHAKDFLAGEFPWPEADAWLELVHTLKLPAALATRVHDLAFILPNMIAQLDVGQVTTLSGKRVKRLAPEHREAMRVHFVGWTNFLYQWIEEDGAPAVKRALVKHSEEVAARFVPPF